MEKQSKLKSSASPKRKRKLPHSESEPKNVLFRSLTLPIEEKDSTKKKIKKRKTVASASEKIKPENKIVVEHVVKSAGKQKKTTINTNNMDNLDKYPVLKDESLITRFMKVPFSNNQKGRIRQAVRMQLQGLSNELFPDIINGKIQAILKGSETLTDSDLRRIRILYNMLKTCVTAEGADKDPLNVQETKTKKQSPEKGKESKDQVKKKGPKRYVVFLGNLPLNITKEKIMDHFRELNEQIKSIRIPKVAESNRSAIAYMELNNEPSYELALSKHHSMLGTKRINVLYTAQKNSKITKKEAKSKSAKLIALQKSGKLIGSVPLNKKRSHRRAIAKKAQANKENAH